MRTLARGLLWAALCAGARAAAPTVILDKATVVGSVNGSVTNFFGIPYAQPPVGDLRLRLPVPVAGYSGTINATQVATQCPQTPQLPRPDLPANVLEALLAYAALLSLPTGDAPQSEDCLTVSVQVPSGTEPGAKLPVLVYIYGGGFVTGSTAAYRADAVVQRSVEINEPVIYVNMNYRLGVFGFLGGKEVREAGVGNLGLQDQRLALRWIKQYISAFGGDPDKVTIWGESAGAISVSLHMLTNNGDNEGLFRGAIMNSGAPVPTGDIELLQPFYDSVVEQTGCSGSADTLDCLRGVPADAMMAAAATLPTLFSYSGLHEPWTPHADGVFLTQPPQHLVEGGDVSPVPFITGNCLDEGTAFATGAFNVTTDAEFRAYVHDMWFPKTPVGTLTQLFKHYPDDPTAGSPFGTGSANQLAPQYKRMAAFQGDIAFMAPRRFFLDRRATQQPVWSFISKRDFLPGVGVAHGSDIVPVFTQANDLADYVIKFAATLDPNGASNRTIPWPQFDPVRRTVLTLLDGATPLATAREDDRRDALAYLNALTSAYPV